MEVVCFLTRWPLTSACIFTSPLKAHNAFLACMENIGQPIIFVSLFHLWIKVSAIAKGEMISTKTILVCLIGEVFREKI